MKYFLVALTLTAALGGCLTSRGDYYYIEACNYTGQPLDFKLVQIASAEDNSETTISNRQVAEPGGSVFLSYWPIRGRGGRPFVVEWIVALEFESPGETQLALEPGDLLSNPSWWDGSGWRFAVVKRGGELETADCPS